MTAEVATAEPDASVQHVARLMRERDVGSVVLVSDGAPVALITDRDLALAIVVETRDHSERALVHASSPVIGVDPATDVTEAAALMTRHGCRRLVVIDRRRLAGMVTLDDIAAATGDAGLAGRL